MIALEQQPKADWCVEHRSMQVAVPGVPKCPCVPYPFQQACSSTRDSRDALRNITLRPQALARGISASGQFFEQRFGVFQIRRVKPLSEPPVDRSEQVVGFLVLVLLLP